jgi:hypothetical protein
MKKRRIEFFSLCDFEAVEAHLSRMAARGWLLESAGQYWWTYRRAEPQKLTYAVTYFPEASSFNPEPPENQRVLYDYCAAAGWRLAAEWHQMQIFYTADLNPPPLETDEALRLETIHKAMQKNFLPSQLVMLALAVWQLLIQRSSFLRAPAGFLSSWANLLGVSLWLLLAALAVWTAAGYYLWYRRSRKSVAEGGACVRGSFAARRAGSLLLLCVSLLFLVLSTLSIEPRFRLWAVLVAMCPIVLGIALALGTKNGLKWAGVPGKTGLKVTIALSVVACLIVTGLVFTGFLHLLNSGFFERPAAELYTQTMPDGSTHTWELYRDTLPLTVEELDESASLVHYSYERREQESFLLGYLYGSQDVREIGSDAPSLAYELATVKWPPLYDTCRAAYLASFASQLNTDEIPGYEPYRWASADAEIWGAREAWQLFRGDEPQGQYLVFRENKILRLWYDGPLTDAQIRTAAAKLLS